LAAFAAVVALEAARVGRETADKWLESAAWKSVGCALAGVGRRLPVRRSTPSYAVVRGSGMTGAIESAGSVGSVEVDAFFLPGRVTAQATTAATTTGAR
jgi:hypothetical protein